VAAEIARIEGRDLDAMRLYEEAIRSARDNGFVQNEALAYELGSRFYRARGFDEFADTYLRSARGCYARWGADGKVQQIDQRYPRLPETKPLASTATFAARPEQLDLLSVTKASQTISSEIVLDRLVHTLLQVVLEQGGAQRACLILCQDGGLSIEAEATLEEPGAPTSILRPTPVDSSRHVPASLVHYARRTQERVILSDAVADGGRFSGDDYFARHRPKSVVCMPILRQAEVVGLLYLENNLLAGAFTPDRLVALELLATQAAISLEKALLLGKEQTARAAAEEAERRSAFLAEAGALLSESLDYEKTLVRLGRLCVQSLADWCVIDVLTEGRDIQRLAGAHSDPAKEPLLEQLQERYPARWDSSHPAAWVLRNHKPLLMSELTDEFVRSHCEDDEHMRLIRELGTRTALAVPLVARGQTLGVISMASAAEGRRYGRTELGLAQEVAHRAALAMDNARLYRETQQAVRARDEFLTVASHELRTPLAALLLSMQVMRRLAQSGQPCAPEEMSKVVERVASQGERMKRLVNDLLDVSRIATGQLSLHLTQVDLGAVIRDVVKRFETELARVGCQVGIRGDAPVTGRWDRGQIDQVVTNLIHNAIKFGPGQPLEVLIGAHAGMAQLVVRDHGLGIEPARQAHIFDRFERAVSVRHYGGLGLGLYISRHIVEAHGGTIRVESRPGEGSTFTVELPCAGPGEQAQVQGSRTPVRMESS
jgi:signal transduction histidine kinase